MMRHIVLLCFLLSIRAFADSANTGLTNALSTDRVGFPKGYADEFVVLRVVNKPKEHKIVTIYGNRPAASITNRLQLPYPYGSIIVMETAKALEGTTDKVSVEGKGNAKRGDVTGLHVMRREPGFGTAYNDQRAGEWEFVEYKADGTYITPPEKSASCSACHVKAGAEKDFVYQGRLAQKSE